MFRKTLVLLLTLVSVAGAAVSPAAAAPGRATVLSERMLGERLMELVVRSPAVGADVGVRLLLPRDWKTDPARKWPTLYLLHGCCSVAEGHIEWTKHTDVTEYTKDLNALIVMPEAGDMGFYSDWLDGPAWETFHLTELRGLLERDYRSGQARAAAGLSMGGFGALSYAARHPGLFKAAASYSGVVHTKYQDDTTNFQSLMTFFGEDPFALWGHPEEQAANWAAHNPYDQAWRLRGLPVYLASGDGTPGPLDPAGAKPDPFERLLGGQAAMMAERLKEFGTELTTCLYGPGSHTWPYWERELHRSLPMLMESVGVRFTPPVPAPAC